MSLRLWRIRFPVCDGPLHFAPTTGLLVPCGRRLASTYRQNGVHVPAESAQGDENEGSPAEETEELLFGQFSEERLRVDRITARLDETDDLEERADLGSELVRSISRNEDTFERALLPHLEGSDEAALAEMERDREQLREAMDDIHQRTMGIDPRNVHASDGQGFEDTLATVVVQVRALLVAEDRLIGPLLDAMGPDERRQHRRNHRRLRQCIGAP
jgi:hypothetical protein